MITSNRVIQIKYIVKIIISKVVRPGSHQYAHLTNPNLPVGMKQCTSVLMKVLAHASEKTEVENT